MSRTPRRTALLTVVLTAVLAALLAGCAPETSTAENEEGTPLPRQQVGGPAVDVDTPELREAKAAAGVEACVPGAADPVDGGLPDVTLPCFGGGEAVNLSSLEGPLVINLWASWCGPCREEMPVFAEFHDTYGDVVPVLGIDFNDTNAEAAMELVADAGVTYPLLADGEPVLPRYEDFVVARYLPVTLIVDADGEVVHSQAIAFDSLEDLVDVVDDHVELNP